MNALLTSLVADVYTLTNRPDLVGETLLAVKTATLKAHRSDYFYKDLFETGVMFDVSATQQALDYKTLISKWRSLKYVIPYDNSVVPGVPGGALDIVTPDSIVDNYKILRENICYVAGAELQIRTRAAAQYYVLGCYVYPDTGTETFTSWIASETPSVITFEAAATIFKTIGYDEQYAAYRDLCAMELAELKLTNILANGY